jgi:hypothetical protein
LERKDILKIVLYAAIGIVALSLAACSKGKEEKSSAPVNSKVKFRDSTKLKFHGESDTPSTTPKISPILRSLKGNHLNVNQAKTIGDAFDSYKYVSKKEWRDTTVTKGPYFLDYIGWFDVSPLSSAALREGIVKRGLDVKFVVHEDGVAYVSMVSRFEIKTDGLMYMTNYNPQEIEKIVTAIYENREITF